MGKKCWEVAQRLKAELAVKMKREEQLYDSLAQLRDYLHHGDYVLAEDLILDMMDTLPSSEQR